MEGLHLYVHVSIKDQEHTESVDPILSRSKVEVAGRSSFYCESRKSVGRSATLFPVGRFKKSVDQKFGPVGRF